MKGPVSHFHEEHEILSLDRSHDLKKFRLLPTTYIL